MDSSSFKSHDGLDLHYCEWPVARPQAHLALIHGYGEHIGRYTRLAGELNAAGFHVHGYDHRNHGKSPGKRGYIERFAHYVEDADCYIKHVTGRAGAAPLVVLGHSMGGLTLARLLQEHPFEARGAIFSSPFIQIGDDISPLLIKVGAVLSAVLPRLPVVKLEPDKISRVPEEVQAYKHDSLVMHTMIVARSGAELNGAVEAARSGMGKIGLPALIIHGTDDQLAPVAGSRHMYANIASLDKTLKIYEGGYHELFNDLGRETVVADVLAWLSEHI